MFQNISAGLRARNWPKNTSIQSLVDELTTLLDAASSEPIQISQPLQIENHSGGPAMKIVNTGGDARAIEFSTPDGVTTSFGAGLGNSGIVANEVVLMPIWSIPPETLARLGTQGKKTGLVDDTPGNNYVSLYPQNTGPLSGSGALPAGMPPEQIGNGEVGHGYWNYVGAVGPSLGSQVQSGGGAGSGGTAVGQPENQTGGGGNGWLTAIRNTWRSGNRGRRNQVPYVPRSGLGDMFSGGVTGSVTVVTSVAFDGDTCELTVNDSSLSFVSGLYQGAS